MQTYGQWSANHANGVWLMCALAVAVMCGKCRQGGGLIVLMCALAVAVMCGKCRQGGLIVLMCALSECVEVVLIQTNSLVVR